MKVNCLFCALIVACLIVGCQSPIPPQPQQAAAIQPSATIDPNLIEIIDGRMERSKAFRIDGDLRPIWIVSGRIKNESPEELKRVTFRFSIVSKATSSEVDTAVLTIDTDIAPRSVGSFSREIQILPPKGDWGWSYAVVKAIPK